MTKFIPKWLFQLLALGSVLLIGIQVVSWALNNDGLYQTIANWIPFFDDDSLEKTLLTGLLTFLIPFIPWLIISLMLREFTIGMKSMKDEIAYLRGDITEPQQEPFKTPQEKARFMGVVAIMIGLLLLGINVVMWDKTRDGFIALWLAVPVSIGLGIYAITTGKFPQR